MNDEPLENRLPGLPSEFDQKTLNRLKTKQNPENERTGHYTGRCHECGSKDLWDSGGATYGCNTCKAIYTP